QAAGQKMRHPQCEASARAKLSVTWRRAQASLREARVLSRASFRAGWHCAGCSSAWKSTAFGTQEPLVQIQSPRPSFSARRARRSGDDVPLVAVGGGGDPLGRRDPRGRAHHDRERPCSAAPGPGCDEPARARAGTRYQAGDPRRERGLERSAAGWLTEGEAVPKPPEGARLPDASQARSLADEVHDLGQVIATLVARPQPVTGEEIERLRAEVERVATGEQDLRRLLDERAPSQSSTDPPADGSLTLTPGLLLLGGVLGWVASRLFQRRRDRHQRYRLRL